MSLAGAVAAVRPGTGVVAVGVQANSEVAETQTIVTGRWCVPEASSRLPDLCRGPRVGRVSDGEREGDAVSARPAELVRVEGYVEALCRGQLTSPRRRRFPAWLLLW